MSGWAERLAALSAGGAPVVLVSVVATAGSSPRETGARMLVTASGAFGTIGGGELEHRATALARAMLAGEAPPTRLERFPLGARLGQCCGGTVHLLLDRVAPEAPWTAALAARLSAGGEAVLVTAVPDGASAANVPPAVAGKLLVTDAEALGTPGDDALAARATDRARALLAGGDPAQTRFEAPLLYERLRPEGFDLALFGAGHVGRAVIAALAALPCRVLWIDARAEQFPDAVPANTRVLRAEVPEEAVTTLPSGAFVLVMTHSHALDRAIVERVLGRAELPWCGLIGSATKRRLFERRLLARGLAPEALGRLVCPIGLPGIDGKRPAEIAIAVAAQILATRDAAARAARVMPSAAEARAGGGPRGRGADAARAPAGDGGARRLVDDGSEAA